MDRALEDEFLGNVMDEEELRSRDVIQSPTAAATSAPDDAWARFESLYRATKVDLFAYVATLLRDPMAAEDVTALAFERAYRRRRTFDRRRGEERAWLFGIARNAALDELRRRRRTAALVTDVEDESEQAAVEDQVEVALRRTTVRNALTRLPARDREIVALKFHGGLSNAELAQVLGVSESNAGTMLHRAMQKLRKECDANA